MSTSALLLTQLRAAYESSPGGAETVAAIAAQFGLEEDVVKAILTSTSAVYRLRQAELENFNGVVDEEKNPFGEHPAGAIPDATVALLQEAMIQTALSSGDERLRFRAQCRVIDEARGRLDKKILNQTNITVFQNHFAELKKLRELRKIARGNGQKVLEVTAEPVNA